MSSFEIPLQPRWRSALFLVALLAGCGLVAFEALRIGTAATLGGSVDVLKLRRAVALDPANPALHHRLGLFSFYALDNPLPSEGLRQLQLATQLNGSIATYWVGLASAYDSIGDRSGAGAAFARAVALSPTTPRFHWLAGNYDLRTGQSAEAMSEFARLLSLVAQITARPDSTAESDQYIPAVFELCLGDFWPDCHQHALHQTVGKHIGGNTIAGDLSVGWLPKRLAGVAIQWHWRLGILINREECAIKLSGGLRGLLEIGIGDSAGVVNPPRSPALLLLQE